MVINHPAAEKHVLARADHYSEHPPEGAPAQTAMAMGWLMTKLRRTASATAVAANLLLMDVNMASSF